MSTYTEVEEKQLSLTGMQNDLLKKVRRSVGLLGNSQKGDLFHGHATEKRSRREIANCNERRRMQSINSGFESLKTLLPTEDGEKLSKAAILQLTSKYIQHLVGENRRMRDQLSQLQQQQQRHADLTLLTPTETSSRKRKVGSGDGGGGGVLIGYFQQQQQHAQQQQQGNAAARTTQPIFQLAVKPDYEQFVIEPPPVAQLPVAQAQLSQAAKPKRLEHLMMAIERIEGKAQGEYPPPAASPADQRATPSSASADEPHPAQLLQQQEQPAIMISPFTPHCDEQQDQQQQQPHAAQDSVELIPASQQMVVVDLADPGQLCRPRAIPHKYLHRPQVVQANRSN